MESESGVGVGSRSRFSKLLESELVFKNAGVGVGFKKVGSRSRFFGLEQFMGWSQNPKKSSDSTTLVSVAYL